MAVSALAFLGAGIAIGYRIWDERKSADNFSSLSDFVSAYAHAASEEVATTTDAISMEENSLPPPMALPTQTAVAQEEASSQASDPAASGAPSTESAQSAAVPTASAESPPQSTPESQPEPEPTVYPELAAYHALQSENPDFMGWIRVEDTVIDYPVMRSPDEPERYLHRDFQGEYSVAGTPFVLPISDPEKPSDNITIYAHHMKNGSMFAALVPYEQEEAFRKQPYVQFNTLYDRGLYQIIAVFRTYVGSDFRYYAFADAATAEEFDAYVQSAKALSLYDTGVSAAYGDKLITLSTCDYHDVDGRLVVVAKKVEHDY